MGMNCIKNPEATLDRSGVAVDITVVVNITVVYTVNPRIQTTPGSDWAAAVYALLSLRSGGFVRGLP
jgi:hypothetical protein